MQDQIERRNGIKNQHTQSPTKSVHTGEVFVVCTLVPGVFIFVKESESSAAIGCIRRLPKSLLIIMDESNVTIAHAKSKERNHICVGLQGNHYE